MPPATAPIAIGIQFQSAPGREAGRCVRLQPQKGNIILFQSAPGREAGRCRQPPVHCFTRKRCFNPRPAGRPGDALGWSLKTSVDMRFNPRPAGRPGDALQELGPQLPHRVSIRARPGGRAMRIEAIVWHVLTGVSIRARPGGRAMHRLRRWMSTGTKFQSAPGREAGRCTASGTATTRASSFNPRPAGRPGDAPYSQPLVGNTDIRELARTRLR